MEKLVEKGVLQQGSELRCPNCFSNLWYPVQDLKPDMRCDGCLSAFKLKPEPKWSFRLNTLVRDALYRHGLLAVVQALCILQQHAQRMFLYLPCQDISEDPDSECFTDLDLLILADGRFVIGEVKSDPAAFQDEDFRKLSEVAESLLPNELVFAAPGSSWPETVLRMLNEARERLQPLGIEVTDLKMQWHA